MTIISNHKKYSVSLLIFLFGISFLTGIIKVQAQQAGTFSISESNTIPLALDTNAIAMVISTAYKWQHQQPDSCIALLHDIVIQCRETGFLRGLGGALAELGGTYMIKGDYRKAEQYLRQSLIYPSLSTYITDNAWNNMGSVYADQGKYEKAIPYFKKAIDSRDQNIAVSALNNFTVLLLKLDRYDEAFFYIEKQKAFARKWKQNEALAAALCNEASIYLKNKDFEKFDSLAQECLQLSRSLKGSPISLLMTANIGNSYVARGKPALALPYFQTIEAKVPYIEPEYQAAYYNEFGAALLSAGKYAAAVDKLQSGISLSNKIGIADVVKATADLAEAYYRSGNYEKAARQYRIHLALKDSIQNTSILNKVNEYEVKFRTVEKDKELLEKKLVILKQEGLLRDKNIQLGIILSVVALLIIAGVGMYRSAKNTKQLQIKALEIVKQQARIKQLNAAIDGEERERKRLGQELHDGIGSMLSALNMHVAALKWKNRSIPEMNELDNIVKMVQDVAVEVRKSAHNLTPDYLLHDGLLKALQSLAAQVNTNNFKLLVSGYGDLQELQPTLTLAIYRIIQELINNILKHADAQIAYLQIRKHDNILSITLEDNGKGFEVAEQTDGIGLKQISARMEAINGHLSIDSAPGKGTTVYLEFDLKNLKTVQ